MECRLAYTPDQWSCQISVRLEFVSAGARLDEVQGVRFGSRSADKALVEPGGTGTREAAVARFVGMDLDEVRRNTDPKSTGAKTLAFSRNTICVDLAHTPRCTCSQARNRDSHLALRGRTVAI